MHQRVISLCVILTASSTLNGCSALRDPCAAPVTGTATYVSGSVPPPYHYEWTVRLEASSGTVTYSPGYGSSESWSQTFTPDADQVARVCRQVRREADSETPSGGGTLTVAWRGDSGRSTKLETSDEQAADVVRSAVPAGAWLDAQSAYEHWQQTQRR